MRLRALARGRPAPPARGPQRGEKARHASPADLSLARTHPAQPREAALGDEPPRRRANPGRRTLPPRALLGAERRLAAQRRHGPTRATPADGTARRPLAPPIEARHAAPPRARAREGCLRVAGAAPAPPWPPGRRGMRERPAFDATPWQPGTYFRGFLSDRWLCRVVPIQHCW